MGRGAVRPTDLRFCKKKDLNYHRGAYKLECEACFLNRRMARGWKVEGRNNGKLIEEFVLGERRWVTRETFGGNMVRYVWRKRRERNTDCERRIRGAVYFLQG